MDTSYTTHVSKAENRIPVFRDITVRNVRVEDGGKVTLMGMDAAHPLGIQFDNVSFADAAAIKVSAVHADVKVGPGPFNLTVSGDDVRLVGSPGQAPNNACTNKFVNFPAF
jgi:hypothetical protein